MKKNFFQRSFCFQRHQSMFWPKVCGILGDHFASYRGRNDRLARRTHPFFNEVVDLSLLLMVMMASDFAFSGVTTFFLFDLFSLSFLFFLIYFILFAVKTKCVFDVSC